jgi:organic hydroperoxide reductase OsmC/OhrA
MTGKRHTYRVSVEWIGNRGAGTAGYAAYGRDHIIGAGRKPPIAGSSDAAFRGDNARWNPEDLLVASISACHKLWYLHLCATSGIVVVSYRDAAEGTMVENADGAGRFVGVVLRPQIVIGIGGDVEAAFRLHDRAHECCFIANSVNFAVTCEPVVTTSAGPDASDRA